MYCPGCGTSNQDGYAYCTKCGRGLAPTKKDNTLLWVILLLLVGLPLLTMLMAAILYIMVMGFG